MELAEILINKVESGDHNYQTLADLYSLLNISNEIQEKRLEIWNRYNEAFSEFKWKYFYSA